MRSPSLLGRVRRLARQAEADGIDKVFAAAEAATLAIEVSGMGACGVQGAAAGLAGCCMAHVRPHAWRCVHACEVDAWPQRSVLQ